MGTADPSAFLSTPLALEQHEEWGGKEFRQNNHRLMKQAQARIMEEFPYFLPSGPNEGLAMASFLIPAKEDLYDRLFTNHNIEVFLNPWEDKLMLRISCFGAYNTPSDYEKLIMALKKEGY